MEHTEIAQASPGIAPEGVINAMSGTIPELEGGGPRFRRSNLTLDGRMLASGGVYREVSGI